MVDEVFNALENAREEGKKGGKEKVVGVWGDVGGGRRPFSILFFFFFFYKKSSRQDDTQVLAEHGRPARDYLERHWGGGRALVEPANAFV